VIEEDVLTLKVYEKELIHMIGVGVAIDLIIESIKIHS